VDDAEAPEWGFVEDRNRVVFARGHNLAEGAIIRVNYDAQCLDRL
jgi:hypothetical protein